MTFPRIKQKQEKYCLVSNLQNRYVHIYLLYNKIKYISFNKECETHTRILGVYMGLSPFWPLVEPLLGEKNRRGLVGGEKSEGGRGEGEKIRESKPPVNLLPPKDELARADFISTPTENGLVFGQENENFIYYDISRGGQFHGLYEKRLWSSCWRCGLAETNEANEILVGLLYSTGVGN